MVKKIRDENGKVYVQKKPIYKRVWFWILVVVLVAIIGGSLGGGSEGDKATKVDSKDAKSSKTAKEDPLKQDFKVGDTVSYKGYEIKVNTVEFSDGAEYNKPAEGKQFVIVNLTITNNTKEKQSYNPFNYALNADGNATDMMGYVENVETLHSGDLDPGATVTGNLVGEAATTGNLKLQYKSSLWNDETVDINLK